MSDAIVHRLSRLAGLADGYKDAFGRFVATPRDVQCAILGELGYPCGDEGSARDSLAALSALRSSLLPPLVVARAGKPSRVALRPDGRAMRTVDWTLTSDNGTRHRGRSPVTMAEQGPGFGLPALAMGYYELRLTDAVHAPVTVLSAPPRCWEPPALARGERHWGVAAQIYGLRRQEDFGIGDYTALAQSAAGVGAMGGAFLGMSPLHALFPADRSKISPYSPSSRLFLESILIDPAAIPGFDGGAAELAAREADRIAALNAAPLIDYAAVWAIKQPVLEKLWRQRRADKDFLAFQRGGGDALRRHAAFDALSEYFRGQGLAWLEEWPPAFRDPGAPAVAQFQRDHADRVEFYAWLQFIADGQLASAAQTARDNGMAIGLYRDLAVGADRGGSEIWSDRAPFSLGLSIGAPPDALAPNGQDWGIPPLNPVLLEQTGLRAFRALAAGNMRHAGAIRIDHAFQLQRLFVRPPGGGGGYVDFPFAAMLAALRIESHRAGCLVIGEDLGNAPPGFSDAIMESGIYSCRILSFERDAAGGFRAPGDYPRRAVAMLGTHDLPTFLGWWRGFDTDLREAAGVFDAAQADLERVRRADEKAHLSQALTAQHLDPGSEDAPPLASALRYIGRTASALAAIQFEDVNGELNQPNLPGVGEGHPNWRRRLSRDLAAIFEPGGNFAKLAAALAEEGRGGERAGAPLAGIPPRATYRLQFHKDFAFDDAIAILPYLARLGVSHVYASPILKARPGSTHGYDIVDHNAVNPELGGAEGFARFCAALRDNGLQLLLDIVPNHMGVGGADNADWLDVLEWGEWSPRADMFDIDWTRLGADRKLIVPFLSERYGAALESGSLQLRFDAAGGGFDVWHYEHRFPLTPPTYPIILERALGLMDIGSAELAPVYAIIERLRAMSGETDPAAGQIFPAECAMLKARLAAVCADIPALAQAIERIVAVLNGAPDAPGSFDTLHRLLDLQHYRLAHWRVAASDINYRRFFEINALAGVRVEQPGIFRHVHELLFEWVRAGCVQGLRVDHIDGLADPEAYLGAVQDQIGPGFYIVAEKILGENEKLRSWRMAGATGYEVLAGLDRMLVDPAAERDLTNLYGDLAGPRRSLAQQTIDLKAWMLENGFASELGVLTSDAKQLADSRRDTRDFPALGLRRALIEILARLPVYRTYIAGDATSVEDRRLVLRATAEAKRHSSLADQDIHDFIAGALLDEGAAPPAADRLADIHRRFRRRFQQLSGPVMAKSVEDTLFYRDARFIMLNEVGGNPARFGGSLAEFHAANRERARLWPYAMIATATHDTKRGEDMRARLAALSQHVEPWRGFVRRAEELSTACLTEMENESVPDANDRYFLYQTVIGAWPPGLAQSAEAAEIDAFRARLEGYLVKSLREAKRRSSWIKPHEEYETATIRLLAGLLGSADFQAAAQALLQILLPVARRNALVRTVLKCTIPGVPDFYQGTEFWDFALVDPDNRRPVDFAARQAALKEAKLPSIDSSDARCKQWIMAALLADRAADPALYADGDYSPVAVSGQRRSHVIAFRRQHREKKLVVIAPYLMDAEPDWGDARLGLEPGAWRDVLTGEPRAGGDWAVRDLCALLPFAVLRHAP